MRKTSSILLLLAGGYILQGNVPVFADVKIHPLFGDNMVLQQGIRVPVWGTADCGEKVTVRFQGQEVSAQAEDGKWTLYLEKLQAGGTFQLTVHGKNKLEFTNVLVGEVWVCSGQSNMAWRVQQSANSDEEIASSQNPLIRLFTVAQAHADNPLATLKGNWQECGPKTVGSFSAVGYFFGRDLQKAIGVPVGLISSSVGGTPAEAWTSRKALEANPALKGIADQYSALLKDYPQAREKYLAALEKHKQAVAEAKKEGKMPPRAPQAPMGPESPRRPAALYNGMIAPLIPFGIRGAIWYQGESNAGQAYLYRSLFPAMIQNWRDDWRLGDFPFLFVQLAPYMKIDSEPKESAWAELREAQLLTTKKLPNTAMAVITDVGEENDIHPKKKGPVGGRLALAARSLAYGEKIAFSGPVYRDMKVKGDRVFLTFDHVGGGLVVKGDRLEGFTIAGADRKFVAAEAQLQDGGVIVSSPKVPNPVAIRFGWANYPVVNLWNKDGLPATPFRTDDFPITTGS
jgi:sialate O-acetylesterase